MPDSLTDDVDVRIERIRRALYFIEKEQYQRRKHQAWLQKNRPVITRHYCAFFGWHVICGLCGDCIHVSGCRQGRVTLDELRRAA